MRYSLIMSAFLALCLSSRAQTNKTTNVFNYVRVNYNIVVSNNVTSALLLDGTNWFDVGTGERNGVAIGSGAETDPIWTAASNSYTTVTAHGAETNARIGADTSLSNAVAARGPLVTNPVSGTVAYYNGTSWVVNTNLLWLGTNWLFYWTSTNSPARMPCDGE